ncbi:hypothetical protein IPL68_02930 [Candidatus Saccharibacteria bacterium]|nr:MAG: hypothetical protein IPL68_02930 [Candidatus Saccharibacteria bacterium]
MQVSLLGNGVFGSAIGSVLEHNGVRPQYADIGQPLTSNADVLIILVPTQAIRSALKDNSHAVTDSTIIVSCSKGIEEATHFLPHQIVADMGIKNPYYSLLGPSFAENIIERQPTIMSLGYDDYEHVDELQSLLQNDYFRIRPIEGCEMLEMAAAFKNIYAISCGYAQGLGYGANTRAALITLALQEFAALAHAKGFTGYDVLSPGVLGDMVLTCSSDKSRNFQFGHELAESTDTAHLSAQAKTTEGYHTAHSVLAIAEQAGLRLPLAELTARVVHHPGPHDETFRAFMAQC